MAKLLGRGVGLLLSLEGDISQEQYQNLSKRVGV